MEAGTQKFYVFNPELRNWGIILAAEIPLWHNLTDALEAQQNKVEQGM